MLIAFFGLAMLGVLSWDFWFPGTFKVVETFEYQALARDLGLVALFGFQHSLMARKDFKAWWTQMIPAAVERNVYVMLSGFVLVVMGGLWQSFGPILWDLSNTPGGHVLMGISILGFLIASVGAISIDPSGLIGWRQTMVASGMEKESEPGFSTPGIYQLMRHPIYVGFMIAFWATPSMTFDHIIFSTVMTIYLFIGIWFEERDLLARFGDKYRAYMGRIGVFFPKFWR